MGPIPNEDHLIMIPPHTHTQSEMHVHARPGVNFDNIIKKRINIFAWIVSMKNKTVKTTQNDIS